MASIHYQPTRYLYSLHVHKTLYFVQQPLLQHHCTPQNVVVRHIGTAGVLQLLGINEYAKRTVPFSIARPTRSGIIKTHVII